MTVSNPHRLADFIRDFTHLVDQTGHEPTLLEQGGALLAGLVANDDWLPAAFAQPIARGYGQYLLHRDLEARFSVVSFVWGPGQGTPVHDHTVWGLIGVLRGAEISQSYSRSRAGLSPSGPPHHLQPGQVEAVSPSIGDIHQVKNALVLEPSISIHVYGGDIGVIERSSFDAAGRRKPFVSGYSNASRVDA